MMRRYAGAVKYIDLVARWTLLLTLIACAIQADAEKQRSGPLILDSHVVLLVSPDEPVPVKKAAADLASDFEKVLGSKPEIIEHENDAAPMVVMISEQSRLPESLRPAGLTAPESFSISVTNTKLAGKRHRIVLLAGADMRGVIYAIYEFSQEYLGIDPLYYWTDQRPTHRDFIAIPADLHKNFPVPVFRYRGFFINDEDLLTGWAPGVKDGAGISLAVWNKVYETILRLKGNMVAPGTWIFPDEPQVKLASERGLILTQHHAIPLGLNVARWPADVPYNYSTHPEILEQAWKNAVHSYLPNQEVLWTVGLRGLSDVTYASMDPNVRDNNQALGQLITKAIADQMSIVRAVHPDAKFVTSLWQEGARLVQQGYLKIPPEVTIVWADDGYGYLQDKGEVAAGQGAYDHIAMMNGRANQLTEMVPVERSFSEIARYIKAGATGYYLVNTSDIRPVTMSARAVMDAVWKGIPEGNTEKFYQQWAEEEFGKKAAPKIADVYKEYFKAPAHFGDPVHEYGDQLYHTEARRMLLTYMIDSPLYALPSQAPKWEQARNLSFGPNRPPVPMSGKEWLQTAVAHEVQQCGDAQRRWDAVWNDAVEAEAFVDRPRLPFYRASVLAMIAINRESNRVLYLVSKAIQDAEAGHKEQANTEAVEALKAFDSIQNAEADAEYGQWKSWYRGDWLTGIPRTRELVQIFANYVEDPLSPLPPPVLWDGWEAYYHIMQYEGDRSVEVK